MPHGITNYMRNIRLREPEYVKRHAYISRWARRNQTDEKGVATRRPAMLWGGNEPHVNPDKDRRLAGKARVAERKARRRTA